MGYAFARAVAFALALFTTAAQAVNYSDIWWNPAESGWGITIADHDSQLFAVWFTYGPDGRPTWYVVPGGTFAADKSHFQGDVYATTGPPFSSAPFDPSRVTTRKVGTAAIDFTSASAGTFTYDVAGVRKSKVIQRQPFGDGATDWGNDVTDIWWNPDESGWGLTLAQHGNNVFGVWFTYDTDGQPLWVVLPGVTFNGADAFTGTLYTTTGPYFGAEPFDPARVVPSAQGSATINVTREGRLDIQCTGAQNAAFKWTFRGVSASPPICQQAFGELPGVPGPAVALPTTVPTPPGPVTGPGTLGSLALALITPQLPELASITPAVQRAEHAMEVLLLPRLGKDSPAKADAFTNVTAGAFNAVTQSIIKFQSAPRGASIPSSPTTTNVDGATIKGDLSGGRSGDGTAFAKFLIDITADSPDGPVNLKAASDAQGLACPAADGSVPFKLHLIVDAHATKNGKLAGTTIELLLTGSATVNDAAKVAKVDFDWRLQQSLQRPESHNAYADMSYKGALIGEFGSDLHARSDGFKVNRTGSTTTADDVVDMGKLLTQLSAGLQSIYLVFLQVNWQDGNCVTPVATIPSTVAPGSSTSIQAKVHYKPDDLDVPLPLDAKLDGAASVQPPHLDRTPGTFVYVAPSQTGKAATINLKTTSRRGIGELALTTVTSAVGYVVDWSDGAGNHVFGTICGGLTSPFTLNFDSGGQITGTLSFRPSGASGGTVHLAGSGGGGVLIYSGDGTYTVTDSPLTIHLSIPRQVAVYPGGSVAVPGPSGDLPVNSSSQCGGS
jgi:hypothetical protein